MINLKISTRLWIGFGVMMLITLVVVVLAFLGMSSLKQANHELSIVYTQHMSTADSAAPAAEISKQAVTELNRVQGAAEASAGRYQLLVLLGALCSVICAVVCAVLTTRTIVNPLNNAVAVAKAVAAGNLTSRINATGDDEFSQLLHALDDMSQSLHRFVTSVRGSSDSISVASRELSMGNADLSQRTEQQASSIEETAANMEELNSTVRRNADSAKEAERLSIQSSEVAMRGGSLSTQLVHSMQGITESSQKASEIISVIDGIAFQTNILALNAAVEAARAGEHGRGFAVVATEVRTLAQRSATASKEIKDLILESMNRAEEGSALVAQTGHTMEEIVMAAKQVVDIMREISSASQEQSNGINEVNSAINQIEQVTQQNAALVEQAAAAAESMEEQARTLMRAVEGIRVGGSTLGEPVALPGKNVTPLKAPPKTASAPVKPVRASALPNRPAVRKPMIVKKPAVPSTAVKTSAKPAAGAAPVTAPTVVADPGAIKSPVRHDDHRFEPSISEDEWERF